MDIDYLKKYIPREKIKFIGPAYIDNYIFTPLKI